MNADPHKEPQVPVTEPDTPFFAMREAFLAREDLSSPRNMHSAGLNAYGDFVIKSWCGELIKIPHHERARLAAYLLSPWIETDDPAAMGWVKDAEDRLKQRAVNQRQRQKIDKEFKPETKKPGGKGIIARQ